MLNDYFTILRATEGDLLKGELRIALNPDCGVYAGHFPNEPVSPGVCNIEMLRQCAETIHHRPLRIRRVKQCRLTALMTPLTTPQANVSIDLQEQCEGTYRLTASISEGETTYLTLKADVTDE